MTAGIELYTSTLEAVYLSLYVYVSVTHRRAPSPKRRVFPMYFLNSLLLFYFNVDPLSSTPGSH